MACRKDGKGRVLRKGEHYRKTDGRYSYIYTDPLGKKRTIYAKSLVTLRQKEDELVRDQMDGLNVYVAGSADVNFLFDRYISTKTELRSTTKALTKNPLHYLRYSFTFLRLLIIKYLCTFCLRCDITVLMDTDYHISTTAIDYITSSFQVSFLFTLIGLHT